MNTKDITPKAEPVTWGLVVAAAVSALISYNVHITNELAAFLVMIAPFVGTAVWARFRVYAPDTVERIKREQYEAGLDDAQPMSREAQVTEAINQLSGASGQGARRRAS